MMNSRPPIRTPGHLIRRLQQVSVALFHSSLERSNITPIQYTILVIIEGEPGLDQISIATRAVLDTSTVGDVLRRLEGRGLIRRETVDHDKRSRVVFLTEEGRQLLAEARPQVSASRAHMLSPLSTDEQQSFLEMIERLLAFHEDANADDNPRPWQRERKKAR